MSNEKYVELGGTLELPSGLYKCVLGNKCSDCEIPYGCLKIACTAGGRIDHKEVIFINIQKKHNNESNRKNCR